MANSPARLAANRPRSIAATGSGSASRYWASVRIVRRIGLPRASAATPATTRATTMLRGLVGRIAAVGRLRVAEEQAVALVHAAACGSVLTLLATAAPDPAVSGLAREAVLAAVIADAPAVAAPGPVGAAVALRAALADTDAVTTGERGLLEEWLDRIAATAPR